MIADGLQRELEKLGAGDRAGTERGDSVAPDSRDTGSQRRDPGHRPAGQAELPVADVLRARGVPFVFTTSHEVTIIPEPYRSVPCFEKPVDMQEAFRAILT
jgi:hypothetical protein